MLQLPSEVITSLLFHTVSKDNWIVDTGASDRIIGSSNVFASYEACTDGINISITNVSVSQVVGFGNVNLSGMTLTSVLHVPSFRCNLFSVSKRKKVN